MVSAGNGPATGMPCSLSSRTAGAMMSISSLPQSPPSPLCGLSPATATRGAAMPLASSDRYISVAAPMIRSRVMYFGTSASGTCEEMREVHRPSSVLNSQKYPVAPRYWAKWCSSSSCCSPPSFMACLFSGAKQIASTSRAIAASMQRSSTFSTEAPPAASERERTTCSGCTVSMGMKAGREVSARPRTAAKLSTRSVGTSTPAMCWPSAHSHASPTSTTLAVARVSGRASSRATSSGPMPAGSPSVTATTGLS